MSMTIRSGREIQSWAGGGCPATRRKLGDFAMNSEILISPSLYSHQALFSSRRILASFEHHQEVQSILVFEYLDIEQSC